MVQRVSQNRSFRDSSLTIMQTAFDADAVRQQDSIEAILQAGLGPRRIDEIARDLDELRFGLPRETLARHLDALIREKRIKGFSWDGATAYQFPLDRTPGDTHLYAKYVPATALMARESAGEYGSTPPSTTDLRSLGDEQPASEAQDACAQSTIDYVPLSAAGLEVRYAVRRPIHLRPLTHYNREFLSGYRPNVDRYLPADMLEQLHEMGATTMASRPAGTYARHVFSRLLIDLSWASSRLEGNTYSRLETQRLIEHGEAARGKDYFETQMILNHKAAIELLVENADRLAFDRLTVLNLHAALSDGLMDDQTLCVNLRRQKVDIWGTDYKPLTVPQQIDECFNEVLAVATEIDDPFEQAFFAMVHLPYLQPFGDVNKRVSRLAVNIPLIRHNLCPLSFVDVPEKAYVDGMFGVYELNRIELLRDTFLWAYQRSCSRYLALRQVMRQPDVFRMKIRLALQEAVREVVSGNLRGTPRELESLAVDMVAPDDIESFVAAVTGDLDILFEGNFLRYGLRRSEYLAWSFKRNKRKL
ncbi:MAG: cell filamentation protein Fic [Rhizobacter sp.]|nr:cell filamentation protein Fic [Rhizobacter sp.]